jgi:hypothetical protein
VRGEEKKVPKKKTNLDKGKGKKKGQLEFATMVNPGTGRDEKGARISAPFIHVGAMVGADSFWPKVSKRVPNTRNRRLQVLSNLDSRSTLELTTPVC